MMSRVKIAEIGQPLPEEVASGFYLPSGEILYAVWHLARNEVTVETDAAGHPSGRVLARGTYSGEDSVVLRLPLEYGYSVTIGKPALEIFQGGAWSKMEPPR